MTIKEAIKNKVKKVRLPQWNPEAYLELPLLKGGGYTPWAILNDVGGYKKEILITDLIDDSENTWEKYL